MIIGVSTHSMEQAKNAEREGADFITLGPVYETPAKMRYGAPLGRDIIEKVKDGVSVPVFAIGGIKKERVGEVLKAGACGIALISGILGSGDIYNETKEFMRLLK
jgi:thiamine-phosphate pyrophosphorylase